MFRKFTLALLLVLPLSAQAEQPKKPNQEQMAAMVQMMRDLMVPLVMEFTEVMMDTQFRVLSERETAKALASYSRNYFEELIEAGFSRNEALALTSAAGIPVLPVSVGQN